MAGLYVKDKGGDHGRLRRRPEDPAGRPLHRRLPGRREGRQPGHQDRSTATRRTSSTRRSARSSRSTRSQQGAKVVFQVAGQCGLGALDAAKEKGVQGIGVDADQAYLGDQILTSALKKVDVAVFDAIKDVQDDTFKGGADTDLRRQVGRRRHRQDQRRGRQVRRRRSTEVQDKIASGEIADIPTRSSRPLAVARRRRARPRAPRHHQALRDPGRERRGRLRAAPWRDPRAARGERRGQVDADERPLRAASARRGRDPARRRAGHDRLARARPSASASAWSTSTSCSSRS